MIFEFDGKAARRSAMRQLTPLREGLGPLNGHETRFLEELAEAGDGTAFWQEWRGLVDSARRRRLRQALGRRWR
jgi:hypothetical protein